LKFSDFPAPTCGPRESRNDSSRVAVKYNLAVETGENGVKTNEKQRKWTRFRAKYSKNRAIFHIFSIRAGFAFFCNLRAIFPRGEMRARPNSPSKDDVCPIATNRDEVARRCHASEAISAL
jgi:hypothetical protein